METAFNRPKYQILLLFSLLPLLSQAQSPAAKNALGHIFDPKACGCIAGEAIDLEAFKTSLGAMNQVAVAYIEQLQKAATSQPELTKVFGDLKNKTSNKPDFFRNSFATKGQAILNTQAGASVKALQMACLLTEQLHLYYLNDPKNAPATERKRYEEALKKGQADPKALEDDPLDSSPDKDPEPNPEEAPKTKPSETAIIEAPKSEGSNGSLVTGLFIGLAIGAALGLFAAMRGRKKPKEDNVQSMNFESNNNKPNLMAENNFPEIEELRREIAALKQENKTLKNELEKCNQTINQQSAIIAELKNQGSKPAHQDYTEELPQPIKEQVAAASYIYLEIPNRQGVFVSAGTIERTANSVYRVKMQGEQFGAIELIPETGVIQRAMSLYSDFVEPVCEPHSRGAINVASLKQTAGKVRRDGSGWRVEQKVILKWD